MAISPVPGLIVLLLCNHADAGKLLSLFYSAFSAFAACVRLEFAAKQGAEPPERTALGLFVSHCAADGAGSGRLNPFPLVAFRF